MSAERVLLNSIQFREVRHLGVKERWPSETHEAWIARVGPPEALTPGAVNIIVGPNGSGKTTILEIIHAFSNPRLFKTLIRESQPSVSSFCIDLYWSTGNVSVSHGRRFGSEFLDFIVQPSNLTFSFNITQMCQEDIDAINDFITKNIPFKSKYVNFLDENHAKISMSQVRDYLQYFDGLLENVQAGTDISNTGVEVINIGTERESLAILFKTDPYLFSCLNYDSLPMGWRRLVALMDAISHQTEEEILLVEEPDTHLHPSLQRTLVQYIVQYYSCNRKKIFLTTHSPTFLNAAITEGFHKGGVVHTFRVAQGISSANDRISDVLIDLGAHPADVFLANGIIWVEGPSDRLYLLRWIADRCTFRQVVPPIEGIDFAILIYGGASAKHHSISGENGIKIVHTNPNYFIVGDSDNGSALKWNNLLREALNLNDAVERCWLLEVRTIETFCFAKEADQVVTQKVQRAASRSIHPDWEETVNTGVDRLLKVISSWSPKPRKIEIHPHGEI